MPSGNRSPTGRPFGLASAYPGMDRQLVFAPAIPVPEGSAITAGSRFSRPGLDEHGERCPRLSCAASPQSPLEITVCPKNPFAGVKEDDRLRHIDCAKGQGRQQRCQRFGHESPGFVFSDALHDVSLHDVSGNYHA